MLASATSIGRDESVQPQDDVVEVVGGEDEADDDAESNGGAGGGSLDVVAAVAELAITEADRARPEPLRDLVAADLLGPRNEGGDHAIKAASLRLPL